MVSIRLHVINANNLAAKDSDGFSDPVSNNKKEQAD
jgi:hypothetical protein